MTMLGRGPRRESDDPDSDDKEENLRAEAQQPFRWGNVVLKVMVECADPSGCRRSPPPVTARWNVLQYIQDYAKESSPIHHLVPRSPSDYQYYQYCAEQEIEDSRDDFGAGVSVGRAEKHMRISVGNEIQHKVKPQCHGKDDPGPAGELADRPTGGYMGCCKHASVYHKGKKNMAVRLKAGRRVGREFCTPGKTQKIRRTNTCNCCQVFSENTGNSVNLLACVLHRSLSRRRADQDVRK